MPQPTPEQLRAIAAIADAIVEAVKAAGDHGAPGGTIYAAMMGHGISLAQYEQFMSGLVRAGKLRKRGELYFVVEAKADALEANAAELPRGGTPWVAQS